MIIGVIGATSNIASKAYLPVYAKMQEEHRFILYSRQWDKAEKFVSSINLNTQQKIYQRLKRLI